MSLMDRFNKMSAGVRGVLLIIVTYLVTIGIAICNILFAITFLIDTHRCSTLGQAMVMLWIATAILFFISVVVVGVVGRKIIPRRDGCLAAVVVHVIALLVSYIVIAFGLLVAFNC